MYVTKNAYEIKELSILYTISSSRIEQRGNNLQERLQSVRHKFPSKQKAHTIIPTFIIIIIIIAAITTPKPYLIQKLGRNTIPSKSTRMRTTLGPIDPSDRPIRILLRRNDIDQSRNVVLVHITRRTTMVLENLVVFGIRNDFDGELAIELQPLRPFSPIGD